MDIIKKRIVIDTNLLIASYFNRRSFSHHILDLAKKGEVRVFWTPQMRAEAELILGRVFRAVGKRDRVLDFSSFVGEIFQEDNKVLDPPEIDVVKDDDEDNKFLACALKAEASYLISNDKHLLRVGKYKNVRVMKPGEFVSSEVNR